MLSISAGKNIGAILDALLPHAESVTVTRAEPARSLPPEEIAAAVRRAAPGITLRVDSNPRLALLAAREGISPVDCLCVAGSVYLAGIARRILRAAEGGAEFALTRNDAIAANLSRAGERGPRAGS